MTHTIAQTYQAAGGAVVTSVSVTADAELNVDVTLSASTSDKEIDFILDQDNAQALCLYCSAACTIKTNSSSAPDDTISLTAGVAVLCKSNAEVLALLSADITKIYVTCSAGGDLKIRSLSDITPA